MIHDLPPLGKTRGLNVKYYADVSTNRLTSKDQKLLSYDALAAVERSAATGAGVEYPGSSTFGVVEYPEGYIVWLGRMTSEKQVDDMLYFGREAGYGKVFLEIVKRAMLAGCSTLIFDQDADCVEGLPHQEESNGE